MQNRPVCFQCDKSIETNSEMVFESPCGHDECSSAVFHALCLFDWRERRQRMLDYIENIRRRWLEEHERHGGESS